MNTMIDPFFNGGNQTLNMVCLSLAALRIYLEIIGFDFSKLPLTKSLSSGDGGAKIQKFHKMGLFISIGYILTTAPGILFT